MCKNPHIPLYHYTTYQSSFIQNPKTYSLSFTIFIHPSSSIPKFTGEIQQKPNPQHKSLSHTLFIHTKISKQHKDSSPFLHCLSKHTQPFSFSSSSQLRGRVQDLSAVPPKKVTLAIDLPEDCYHLQNLVRRLNRFVFFGVKRFCFFCFFYTILGLFYEESRILYKLFKNKAHRLSFQNFRKTSKFDLHLSKKRNLHQFSWISTIKSCKTKKFG
ncbi:hypothetical protein HanIR_Chr12g0599571 [Helianthus annuus]|nr:hypothetical protein HanIR_Chr12g0599571 [Helianthus annuus]